MSNNELAARMTADRRQQLQSWTATGVPVRELLDELDAVEAERDQAHNDMVVAVEQCKAHESTVGERYFKKAELLQDQISWLSAERDAAIKERDALLADKARLDWLGQRGTVTGRFPSPFGATGWNIHNIFGEMLGQGDDIREAIDAAMFPPPNEATNAK